ncbi:hypothetical protein AX15_001189 [Amanita polypyramis BW_CC]|nr:hypothetical protein AX15_001189 [Amanita polypyramis BW_CC]
MPASILNPFGPCRPGYKVIPRSASRIPAEVWCRMVDLYLKPWDEESRQVWCELTTNRVRKLWLYKDIYAGEHEYVVVELTDDDGRTLYLRIDRTIGERIDVSRESSPRPSSSGISTGSADSSESLSGSLVSKSSSSFRNSIARSFSSLPATVSKTARQSSISHPHRKKPSRSSSSIGPIAKCFSNFPARTARRLSDNSLSRFSAISSGKHYAEDTIMSIDRLPSSSKAKAVKSINYKCSANESPSLWDLMILIIAMQEYSKVYKLLERQCFWHADTICAILETWPKDFRGVKVERLTYSKWYFTYSNTPCSGRAKGFVVYRRKDEVVKEVLTTFRENKEKLDRVRSTYERQRIELEQELEMSRRRKQEVRRREGGPQRREQVIKGRL